LTRDRNTEGRAHERVEAQKLAVRGGAPPVVAPPDQPGGKNPVRLLTGDDIGAKERIYRVVWRLGYEIGAKFVGHVRRTGMAAAG
jgi:hypothetical protein